MNKVYLALALIAGVGAWALIVMIGMAIFSPGEFSARACQSDCTSLYYYASMAVAALGVLLSFLAIRSGSGVHWISVLIGLFSLAAFGLTSFLFIAGNFF